jgi:hypothetical protein
MTEGSPPSSRRARVARALKLELAEFKPPPERIAGPDRDMTPVVLAEYSAIRQEIQTALSNQQSALSVGAATLGLLAAVGARFWPQDLLVGGLVFSLAIPAACAMAMRMWYGELLRIARAARFIAELERWANRLAHGRLLVWEHWMDECRRLKGQDIDRTTWRSVVLGFSALALMSTGLGMYWLYEAHGVTMVTGVALANALLVAREWRAIGALRDRALMYMTLPEETDDEDRSRDGQARDASGRQSQGEQRDGRIRAVGQ